MTVHGAHQAQMSSEQNAKSAGCSIDTIKQRVGMLLITIVDTPNKLHPRSALQLLVLLMERHLAIEHRHDVEEFYRMLTRLSQQEIKNAKEFLETIAYNTPKDIVPDEVCEKLNKISNAKKMLILGVLTKQLFMNTPEEDITHLEMTIFQGC